MSNKIIDLQQIYLDMVLNILRKHLQNKDVNVYIFGSRVKGTAKKTSDIDLAFNGDGAILTCALLSDIKSDFQESDLPYIVDIIDLSGISDSFKNFIKNDLVEVKYK
ncbi:MAG: nucleotidyltransferase domain-containing protein [Endomicrobium sp.]|nr:nucleotidyltransferase domain-containing protein [Endomicrobium sp.]